MRVVVQRVLSAGVEVNGETISRIDGGLLVLLGVETGDGEEDLRYIVDKIANLRIFDDENGKMNKSVRDVNGEILLVSQFTLLGDVRRGRRPDYMNAEEPDTALDYYKKTVDMLLGMGIPTKTGKFMAHMNVELCNDGPVTILLDSRRRF